MKSFYAESRDVVRFILFANNHTLYTSESYSALIFKLERQLAIWIGVLLELNMLLCFCFDARFDAWIAVTYQAFAVLGGLALWCDLMNLLSEISHSAWYMLCTCCRVNRLLSLTIQSFIVFGYPYYAHDVMTGHFADFRNPVAVCRVSVMLASMAMLLVARTLLRSLKWQIVACGSCRSVPLDFLEPFVVQSQRK